MSEAMVATLGFAVAVAMVIIQSMRLAAALDRNLLLEAELDLERERREFVESLINAWVAAENRARPAPAAKHLTVIEGGRPSCSDH